MFSNPRLNFRNEWDSFHLISPSLTFVISLIHLSGLLSLPLQNESILHTQIGNISTSFVLFINHSTLIQRLPETRSGFSDKKSAIVHFNCSAKCKSSGSVSLWVELLKCTPSAFSMLFKTELILILPSSLPPLQIHPQLLHGCVQSTPGVYMFSTCSHRFLSWASAAPLSFHKDLCPIQPPTVCSCTTTTTYYVLVYSFFFSSYDAGWQCWVLDPIPFVYWNTPGMHP